MYVSHMGREGNSDAHARGVKVGNQEGRELKKAEPMLRVPQE